MLRIIFIFKIKSDGDSAAFIPPGFPIN